VAQKKNLASTLTRNERLAMIERDGDVELSLTVQTQLLSLCRSSIYYKPRAPSPEEVRVTHLIDEIYTAKPFYGSRRIAVELGRQGITIARKTVQRFMREMDIMAVFPGPNLSRRALQHRVFPYLLRNVSAAHPNHIWGIDVTYIRLRDSWMYLVAIIDWFSRFVVSWELDDTLEEQFVLDAVGRALTTAQPLIWNSDQGSHFTSPQYTKRLEQRGIEISMDGRGRAIDNIFTERLWRSVKYEEVYLTEYATPNEARTGIDRYFRFYNSERPHQSLAYRTPAEVYAGGAVEAVNHPDSPLPQLTTTTK
jgi:putative transposase